MSQPGRVLGLTSAISLVAGSMLGIGIFLTPSLVVGQGLGAPWFFGLWVLVGLTALAGAVAYAELGAMMPEAGGDYIFLREALGPSAAFSCGWVIFGAVFTGSIASLAVPLCEYQLPALLPGGAAAWIQGDWLGLPAVRWLALGLIALVTGVNLLGAKLAAWLQNLTTVIPMLVFTLGALWVLLFHEAPPVQAQQLAQETPTLPGAAALAASYMAIYFAYSGWNAVIYVAGEVKAPGHTLPWSLLVGTGLIMGLYLLLCAAFWKVLGPQGLAEAGEAGTATAQALGGPRVSWWVTLLIAFGLLGTLNGTVLGGARVAMAMARQRAFWSVAQRQSARGVPAWALVIQGAWAGAFALSGTFEGIINLVSMAMLLIGSITVGTLFVLRRRQPARARPYRATGYPLVPAVYVLANVLVMGVMIQQAVEENTLKAWFPMFGVGLLVLAFVGHRLWSGRQAASG